MSFDPMSMFLISSAMSVGQAGMGAVAQAQQASMQRRMNDMATEDARRALMADYDAFSEMELQESQNAAEENENVRREALRRAGTVKTAAGEAGVTGLSVDALLRDIYGQEAALRHGTLTNLERTRSQFQRERSGAHAATSRRLRSLPAVQRPDYLGSALKAGAGIFGAYRDHLYVRPGSKG